MADGTDIYLPGQQTPLVVENMAQPGAPRIIERSWYMFLVGLFNRTGGVAGNAQLSSLDVLGDAQIDGDLNVDGAFTVGGVPISSPVKAWVNFSGLGATVINGQMNVGSVTYNGVGDYTINFATPMTDVNYAVGLSIGRSGGGTPIFVIGPEVVAPTVNSFRLRTLTLAGALADGSNISAIFTD